MTGHSEQLGELVQALIAAQQEFPVVERDSNGQVGSRHYKYATLGKVLETIGPIRGKHGLAISHTAEPGAHGKMRLTTTLMHSSGQFISGTQEFSLNDDTPQGYGSAMTYARRYGEAAILDLAIDEDDDASTGSNRSSGGGQQAAGQRRPAPTSGGAANQRAPGNAPSGGNGAQPAIQRPANSVPPQARAGADAAAASTGDGSVPEDISIQEFFGAVTKAGLDRNASLKELGVATASDIPNRREALTRLLSAQNGKNGAAPATATPAKEPAEADGAKAEAGVEPAAPSPESVSAPQFFASLQAADKGLMEVMAELGVDDLLSVPDFGAALKQLNVALVAEAPDWDDL